MVTESISTMDFDYSETQQMVAASAREFAEQYIRPHVMEWDEKQYLPIDVLKKGGRIGLYGRLGP